ncbi:FCD domain-containing protein [Streptomyces malaysiensis subsp. malaysiensis]
MDLVSLGCAPGIAGATPRIGEEHREIVRAVRSGDPDAAAAAIENHLREGFLAVTAHLGGDETTDPFDDDLV